MSLVAIVGRPNVGKSTLFNRLVGMRKAIVDDTAGVTRDRHYGKCEWCGREFSVVDTGGYTTNSEDVFESAIRDQVRIAIDESDVVLFMVEAATGVTDYDAEIADILRRAKKPVVLCVNKVDSGDKMYDAYQFYSLGLGKIHKKSRNILFFSAFLKKTCKSFRRNTRFFIASDYYSARIKVVVERL